MSDIVYAAIITIRLPGSEKVSANVRLTPASMVTAGGRVKPLRDCTLADLQAFADILEAEVWQEYQAIRLIELADAPEAEVNVTVLQAEGNQPHEPERWLEHAVVLAEAVAEAETAVIEPPATPEATVAETAVAENTAAEITAAESEPQVTVADSEPVQAEREASAESPIYLPPHPEIRIAGRRRPLGHSTWAAVDVLINEPTFRDTQAHALSSMDREVAGVLVGPPPEKQPDGRYIVHVTDSIIAKYTRMHGASVTYTPESWRYVNDKMAELYPDESAVMVGWYHTHPGFGIFLSSMDLFIHQNFFTQIWHIALVLDPVGRRSGFFCWDRPKSQVKAYDFPWPMWAYNSW
jgi:proteasome lid subunit RPN8/RPN11